MFKLFQNIIGNESEEIEPGEKGNLQPSIMANEKLPAVDEIETASLSPSSVSEEFIGQQGRLRESISTYDRKITESTDTDDSVEAYEQLLSHLSQQDSVAEAYKKLANSLHKQGKDNEAASCYRQAIVIEAVTSEAKGKYHNSQLALQLQHNSAALGLDLLDSAFSFQATIKPETKQPANLLQIELPIGYRPSLPPDTSSQYLDSYQISPVEWETAQTFMERALDFCDREDWLEVAQACKQATRVAPQMAEAYKIWGNALQRMNRTAEAMECYGKTIEIQPDLAEVYAAIAKLYAHQQKWQSATEYYQKAIIIKPEFSGAYRSLAGIWEQLGEETKAQICYHRAQELETPRPSLTTAKETSEATNNKLDETPKLRKAESVKEYLQLAEDSAQNNAWQEAAAYYRQALKLNLSEIEASVSAPSATTSSEATPEAQAINSETKKTDTSDQLNKIQTLKKVILNQPVRETAQDSGFVTLQENALGLDRTAKISTTDKSWEQALSECQKEIKQEHNSIELQIQLGDLYATKKKWQRAMAAYSKAVRINPQESQAHIKLANILGKIGNHPGRIEHMYMAYSIDPSLGSAEDHFLLGNAISEIGGRNRAISCYEQTIRLKPNHLEAYQSLAQMYQQLGKGQSAISCYKAAISRSPQNVMLYASLGELLIAQNAWDEAVAVYRRVLQLHPKYPQASQKLNYALSNKLQKELNDKRRH